MHRLMFVATFVALVIVLAVGVVTSSTSPPSGTAEAATSGTQKIKGTIKATFLYTDPNETDEAITTAVDVEWQEDPDFLGGCYCRPFFPTGQGHIDWSYRHHYVYDSGQDCVDTTGGQFVPGAGLRDRSEQVLNLFEDPADQTQYIFWGDGVVHASAAMTFYCDTPATVTAIDFLHVPGPNQTVTTTPSPVLAAVRAPATAQPICGDAGPFRYPRDATRIQGSCYEYFTDGGNFLKYEWDLQINPEPVIFIHGFLGSQIMCGGDELWPHVGAIDRPRLLDMALAGDGVSPATGACNATVGELVETVLGSSVYKTAKDFLNQLEPAGNVYFFNWDWRKSPQESLAALDSKIGFVRSQHQNSKVVLMAHSYGGLLARLYMSNAASVENVARVVTIGTPALGSPKAIFPLYAGVETPENSSLDLLLNNNDLHEFARNLAGDYFLYPSANYGPWLTVGPASGGPLSGQGLLDYITQLGGNAGLLSQALSLHASTLDPAYAGTADDPDFEVVVGTGLPTITGIQVLPGGYISLQYGNGDGTVPAKSAARGPLGAANPNKVHTYYSCRVAHVPLPGDSQITNAIDNFLKFGDPIDGLASPCAFSGVQFRLFRLPAIAGSVSGASRSAAGVSTSSAMSLDDAVLNGVVDYLDLPNEKFIIADGEIPEIALPQGGFLEVTPLSEEAPDGKGKPLLYGPLSGQVTVSVGPGGPAVLVDGQAAPVYGDMNCDGQVTTSDAFLLLLYTAGTPDPQPAGCPDIGSGIPLFGDLNCDSRVTVGDVLAALQIRSGYLFSLRRCR